MQVDSKTNERRKSIRVNTPDTLSNCRLFTGKTEGKFEFKVWPVKNLSMQGIAIMSSEQVAQDALAFLNIDLDVFMETVGVIAKVVWCQEAKVGYEVGMNLCWWPKEDDKELMDDFRKDKIFQDKYKNN